MLKRQSGGYLKLFRRQSSAASESTGIRGLRRGRLHEYISTVGLEVHAQINSKTKLFSSAPSASQEPVNSCVNLLDASVPGTLPSLNRKCVELGVATSLVLGMDLNLASEFDRKHYFYADLPTGYQITQQRKPLARGGKLRFPVFDWETGFKYEHSSGIVQLQLEQDSGKSFHDVASNRSWIDLNRCGVGLMEIVFEPDLVTGQEAAALVRELIFLLKAVGSCNCNMEDGALRVDANVSVRRAGDARLGTRTEVKNLNSLRFVRQAVNAEIGRQVGLVDSGGVVENETRGWDADSRQTVAMRDKEVKQDYRFMPEPNLPPLRLSEGPSGDPNVVDVERIRKSLPKVPAEERRVLMEDFGLDILSATRFLEEPDKLAYFKKVMELDGNHCPSSAGYILSELTYLRKKYSKEGLDDMRIQPSHVLEAAKLRDQDLLGVNLISKGLELIESSDRYIGKTLNAVVENEGWMASSRSLEELDKIIQEGVNNHKKLVGKYVRGNSKGFTTILKNIIKLHPNTDVILLKKLLLEKLEKMKL